MDVFTPKANANGAAIVWVVSGGWFSAHEAINPASDRRAAQAGLHGLRRGPRQPARFTIPEIVKDMNRAVRFIRYHADDYSHRSRPDRDHRRLGRRAPLADAGNRRRQRAIPSPRTRSTRHRAGSRPSACFFPPTDFLNYGKPGEIAVGRGILKGFKPPFDFHEQDPDTKIFVRSPTRPKSSRSAARSARPITSSPTTRPP